MIRVATQQVNLSMCGSCSKIFRNLLPRFFKHGFLFHCPHGSLVVESVLL